MQSKLNNQSKKKVFSPVKSACSLALMSILATPLVSHASTPTKIGTERLVSAAPMVGDVAETTSVVELNDGKYVATWHVKNSGDGRTSIRGQIFSQGDEPIGNAFSIASINSTATNVRTMRNNVSPLNDGGFLVSWEDTDAIDSSKSAIQAARFAADGSKVSTFTIAASVSRYNKSSHAVLKNGNTAVIWQNENVGNDSEIFVKIFDQDLNVVKNTFSATSSEAGEQKYGAISALENGGFVLTWQGQGDDVYSRVFNSNYQYSGSAVKVNTTTGGAQGFADVTGLKDGGYVVVWETQSNEHILGSDRYIYTQRFNANGSKNGVETKANTYSGTHMHPVIKGNKTGGYLVSWASRDQDGGLWGVYAREYQPDGTADGSPFRVNTYTQGSQMYPNTALIGNGEFVVTWSDLDRESVHVQKFTFNEAPTYALSATLPSIAVFEGDTIELPLTAKGAGIYGIDTVMTVNDPLVASFNGGSYGEFLPTAERLSIPLGIADNQWDGALSLKAPYQAKTGEGLYGTATLLAHKPGTVNIDLQSQFTGDDGNYVYQGQVNYSITVLESVVLSGNVADLGITGDYSQVTIFINGEAVQVNPDGSFSLKVGLGNVTIAVNAPGFLSAEKQITLAPNQADMNFGDIALVAGDSNGDNSIDIGDLTQLLGAYRTVSTDPSFTPAADFNRDNKINLQDLTLLGKNFGKQGPQAL
ncbi:dockerin type I domain-containing protein [Pseudoalteromonas luteoviolacea]|uniref:Dockerin domain-containing protein n=1 Tax=Pseudoalteromonas luteoviolacea (strain 2ta16) TaxID=1353533 RepID=V4HYX3_PSEL2|nr:dockerin type I domain-containing protein [Pseudoalteromonas luteoviolacea]ESP93149.1 hypothetical protein PL2TA16_03370 [Pseudoalteromonas luteoviolacea 2ta16]KZN37022.1 hypothetical protein N483_21490 [Pseudoalteromonas luteoviolacea NCIMB 1944]